MARLSGLLFIFLMGSGEVRHFPSIIYGQILVGPGASRYETIFTIAAKKEGQVTLELFTDDGEPMQASFVDPRGETASTDSSFRFLLTANHPLQIKLQLPPDDLKEDVVLKTGWANFKSSDEMDVRALVRILRPDGTVLDRHVLLSQKPPQG